MLGFAWRVTCSHLNEMLSQMVLIQTQFIKLLLLLHTQILTLAHDDAMSGNVMDAKTYNQILNHLFWPGLKSHVAEYC